MRADNKRIILAAFCFYITSMALGRTPPTVRWGHQLITPAEDVVHAAFVDSNDGIYFYVSEKQKDTAGHDIFKKPTILKITDKATKSGVSNSMVTWLKISHQIIKVIYTYSDIS